MPSSVAVRVMLPGLRALTRPAVHARVAFFYALATVPGSNLARARLPLRLVTIGRHSRRAVGAKPYDCPRATASRVKRRYRSIGTANG